MKNVLVSGLLILCACGSDRVAEYTPPLPKSPPVNVGTSTPNPPPEDNDGNTVVPPTTTSPQPPDDNDSDCHYASINDELVCCCKNNKKWHSEIWMKCKKHEKNDNHKCNANDFDHDEK